MGVDNDNSTPASSTGNSDQSYLNDYQGGPAGESPTPDGAQAPESPTGEAGEQIPQEGQPQETALDVVKRAVEGQKEGDGDSPRSDSESQSKETQQTEGKDGEQAKTGEEAEDDPDKDLPFHKHPRWQEVKQERDTFKTRAETAEAKLEQLGDVEQVQEHATNYQQINDYLRNNGLDGQDFQNMLHIGALMKNDPQEALRAIEPYYHALQRMSGEVLPPDLQQQVQDGLMAEDMALNISRERAKAAQLHQQNQRLTENQRQQQERMRQEQQRQQQEQQLQPLYQAADQWEREWQSKDPDYDKLAGMVRLRVQELMSSEKVQTPQDVVNVCNKAHEDVKQMLKQVVPQGRQSQQPLPDGANTGGNTPHAAPQTSLEAAKSALR